MTDTRTPITTQDISQAATLSQLDGFTGKFAALRGGEFNFTFVLSCGSRQVILRVARYADTSNLRHEARALELLHIDRVPRLIHFEDKHRLQGRPWIMESYLPGHSTNGLSLKQFENLGKLVARVHKVHAPGEVAVDYWDTFLGAYKQFGDEQFLLHHPDKSLDRLINRAHEYFLSRPPNVIKLSLVHGDISLGNLLANGDDVSLIDWEFAKFKDPMADFSAIYFDDMEYNRGRWRAHIKDDERNALFKGYSTAGGSIDEDRIAIWMNYEKLGNAVYHYWKIHQSGHEMSTDQLAQYQLDSDNLIASLEKHIPDAIPLERQ